MEKVTAIFDIGKTNKKILLFNESYQLAYEFVEVLPETKDDDGFPCEDITLLRNWLTKQWSLLLSKKEFNIVAVNFTSYGASLVHLDKTGYPVAPLYSYLKPYPIPLSKKLYERYGGKWNFCTETCSPPLGMLNSGLQLYWLKQAKPQLFEKVVTTLHLPQYLSFLFSGKKISEYTSIGCHTALWDFKQKKYHTWVNDEGIAQLLAPLYITPEAGVINVSDKIIPVGSGLHDSSSALIPYLKKFKEPFLLISSGTWCISLNPFNSSSISKEELLKDCLCFLTPAGNPIKASRIFLGKEYEYQSDRITRHFKKEKDSLNKIKFEPDKIRLLIEDSDDNKKLIPYCMEGTGPFPEKQNREWNLNLFSSYEKAYLQLMLDLTCMLKYSVELVNTINTETIFIEGGFGNNELFMNLMTNHFPTKKIMASFLQQATALGAALHINQTVGLENWDFKDYKPINITFPLENYHKKFYHKVG